MFLGHQQEGTLWFQMTRESLALCHGHHIFFLLESKKTLVWVHGVCIPMLCKAVKDLGELQVS